MGLMGQRIHAAHEASRREPWFRAGYWIRGTLEGEADVDEGSDGLDGAALLGMIDEVFLAGLIFGIPFEDIKLFQCQPVDSFDQAELFNSHLGIVCSGVRLVGRGIRRGRVGEGSALESLLHVSFGVSWEVHH